VGASITLGTTLIHEKQETMLPNFPHNLRFILGLFLIAKQLFTHDTLRSGITLLVTQVAAENMSWQSPALALPSLFAFCTPQTIPLPTLRAAPALPEQLFRSPPLHHELVQ